MWVERWRKANKTAIDPRRKVIIWAVVVGVIFSLTDLGEPLENFLHTLRNRTHMTKASGDIIVIGVDDRSIEKLGRWPWPRATLAKIIDNLNENGARQILLDIDVGGATNPVDDQALAQAVKRAAGKIVLPVRFVISPQTGRRVLSLPSPLIRKGAKLANVNNRFNFAGELWRMPFGLFIEGKLYPSMAATLAGTNPKLENWFPVDNSISVKTIPEISAVTAYENGYGLRSVRGKAAILGKSSVSLNDNYTLAGQGLVAGVFSHVIGSETLKNAHPIEVPSLLFCGLTLSFAIGVLFSERGLLRTISLSLYFIVLVGLPPLLDIASVSTDYVPGLVLLAIAWIGHVRISSRSKATLTNLGSGWLYTSVSVTGWVGEDMTRLIMGLSSGAVAT